MRNRGNNKANNWINFLLKSNFDFKKAMKNYKYYGAIEESGLFDEKFYSKTYDDVKGDGLTHYLVKGYLEGRLPSLDLTPTFIIIIIRMFTGLS